MELVVKSLEETRLLAVEIAKKLKPGDVLALEGDLGAGKTTFTNYLVQSLGIESRVQSPTFVIARKYSGSKNQNANQNSKQSRKINIVNHLDLYRLTSSEELKDFGLQDYLLEPNSISIIEWPEVAKELLPKDTIWLKFEYISDNERKVDVQNLH